MVKEKNEKPIDTEALTIEIEHFKSSREIDRHFIFELVRRVTNDNELGAKVRRYVNQVTKQK